jgi:hypothetical protein
MICTLCFTPFDERDSIGSRDGLCQDCWESACSEEWWETVASLQELIPVERVDIEPVELGSPSP